MVITLDAQLTTALNQRAEQQGITPEALALDILRAKVFSASVTLQPRDDWERRLFDLAKDCGVSMPDSALSREALYP